ncbi:MAG: radical SAM protein [Pseudomonadota bacterium]
MENDRLQERRVDVLFSVVPGVTMWRRFPIIEPPFGPSMVVGALRNARFSVEYVDLNLQLNVWQQATMLLSPDTVRFLQDWERVAANLDKLPADLDALLDRFIEFLRPLTFRHAAFSLDRITTLIEIFEAEYGFAIVFADRFKRHFNCPISMGGTALGKVGRHELIENLATAKRKFADYFFFGEGSVSFPLFLQSLDGVDPTLTRLGEHLRTTYLTAYRWNDDFTATPLHGSIDPVDHTESSNTHDRVELAIIRIPPSFSIANAEHYAVRFDRIFPFVSPEPWMARPITLYPFKFMHGCSHRCAFCKEASYRFTARPPAEVVEDLARLYETEGIDSFRFFNAQINISNRYVERFCAEIRRRNLKILFSDSSSLRDLSRDACQNLRDAGCIKLWVGLESPIPRILKLINKDLELDDALVSLRNIHEAGIWVGMNFILGFPGESDAEFEQICQFIRDHGETIDCWNFSPLEVYTGTPMHRNPEQFGIVLEHEYSGLRRLNGHAFSEIGGLDWEARLAQVKKREEICADLIRSSVHRFYVNDHLVFSLFREFGEKHRVRESLRRYVESLQKAIPLKDAGKWLSAKKVLDFDQDRFLRAFQGPA